MSESEDLIERLERRRIELLQQENNDTIALGESRLRITPLESLLPRVSIEETRQEDGSVISLILNVRTLSFGSIGSITSEVAMIKARIFSRIKHPTKNISNINVISTQDITLPLIEMPTGREFHTVKVDFE